MSTKPKVAFYWCASCGGCEETVVDLAEDILGLVEAVDIVMWPVAMDFKRQDIEAMADGSIVASFINGAIRTDEQLEMARLLRKKSQIVIAYGACAVSGGIPALANLKKKKEILDFVYNGSPSSDGSGSRPACQFDENGKKLSLPRFWDVVRSLDQVIEVDYYVPGCPPTPKVTKEAVKVLLEGKLPERGSVLAPDVALCSECPRQSTKPVDLKITKFVRIVDKKDDGSCFLAQGILCMGPGTRSGCGAQCITGNMPCTGCFGPTSRVKDHGAKIMSSICSNIAATEDTEVEKVVQGVADPLGSFYRYGMSKCLLKARIDVRESKND
jgi:F420-non-reducing hydrogenase small subunit